jgi:hypothetical protein
LSDVAVATMHLVCFWHKADIRTRSINVRFWGKADMVSTPTECPLMTQSGHGQFRIFAVQIDQLPPFRG